MIQRIKKHFLKLHNNNDGVSIVTAIIAIGFVLMLISILMSSTVMNFKMRNMNVYGKDSFYSAEQVLDELEVGLEQVVQDSLSQAYISVLTKYNDEDMTASAKNEKVKAEFYENIGKRIGLDGSTKQYVAMAVNNSADNPVGLYTLLKESTRWHEGTSGQDGVNDAYGAFLRGYDNKTAASAEAADSVYVGDMIMTNTDGIYLKNLVVYYRDENGFVSTIKTDIHLIYPDFAFSNPNMPQIGKYSFITDTALEQEHKGVTKSQAYTVSITGSSYAFAIDTIGTKLNYAFLKANDNVHVVATEINIKNGSINTVEDTELWVGDINVESSNVNLNGYSYVADDLNIKGKDCYVTLAGYYYGYGNSTAENGAYSSSAILVNGVNTTLDLQYVKKLILAGRAFVDINANSYKKDAADDADKTSGKKTNRNKVATTPKSAVTMYYTGESISAKSNQLVYLVPSECIAVDEDNNSIYNGNPLTLEQYNSIELNGYTEVALNKEVAKLGAAGNTLGEYLDLEEPVKRVFVRTHDDTDTLVYFYMNFASEEAANLYFLKYYGINYDSVDKYMSLYISAIKLPETGATMKLSFAGNVFNDIVEDGEDKREVPGYIKAVDSANTTISEAFAEDYEYYISRFESYCTILSPTMDDKVEGPFYTYTTRNKKNGYGPAVPVLFEHIVNEESFKEIADDTSTFKDAKNTRVLLLHGATVDTVKQIDLHSYPDVNLIIADCGVEFTGGNKFEGCIIAKGKIKVPSSNFDFVANQKKVDECLNLLSEDQVYYVYEVFMDANELKYLSETDNNSGDYRIQDLVVFENWTKNVEIN